MCYLWSVTKSQSRRTRAGNRSRSRRSSERSACCGMNSAVTSGAYQSANDTRYYLGGSLLSLASQVIGEQLVYAI